MNVRRSIEIDPSLFSNDRDLKYLDHPYITCVDAEQEFVVIYNPRNEYFPLDGYSIADGKIHHTFKFPRRCKIPPRSEYCIYTCPGAPNFDHGSLMEYHVLWTNHDGSLRRMEVLNNDRCDVKLLAPDHSVISHCESHYENPEVAERRRWQEKQNSPVWQAMLRVQVCMVYIRILALVGMAVAGVTHCPVWFITLFWTALACDIFSRATIERDVALTSLSLLGDRLSSLMLTGTLLFLLSTPHTTTDRFGINHTDAVTQLSSTPTIRLGAVAYYPTGAEAPPASPLSAAVQGMAWVGMGVPGLSRRSLWVALLLEALAVLFNLSLLLCPHDTHHDTATDVTAVTYHMEPPGRDPDDPDSPSIPEDSAADAVSKSSASNKHCAQDVYAYIMHASPVLLTVLCVAAEYYQLHCYTSYHYKFDLYSFSRGSHQLSGFQSALLYDLWVLAAALGCAAFNLRLMNNLSLVAGAAYKKFAKA